VFVPGSGQGNFQRVLITTGKTLDGNLIEVKSGIGIGQQVVASALDLQNTADQQ
jgi:cobalt-zinc-cadmium efflux system membrane fusion protein